MVFIDLPQPPLQPLQFRLPFPLQPANGLRHSSAEHGCANRSSHTLRPALPATACGRGRRHRCPALGCHAPSHGKRPRHTRCVSCAPTAVILEPDHSPANSDYFFPRECLVPSSFSIASACGPQREDFSSQRSRSLALNKPECGGFARRATKPFSAPFSETRNSVLGWSTAGNQPGGVDGGISGCVRANCPILGHLPGAAVLWAGPVVGAAETSRTPRTLNLEPGAAGGGGRSRIPSG